MKDIRKVPEAGAYAMFGSQFSSNTYEQTRQNFDNSVMSWDYALFGQAVQLFQHARGNAGRHRLWSLLTQRSRRLLDLNQLTPGLKVRSMHSMGIQQVAIRQIIGTEGRVEDFDDQFNPLKDRLKDRWSSIAMTWLQGSGLPAVSLIQIGDVYFIRDGHHRVSVARTMNNIIIDAEVTVWEVSGRLPWEKITEECAGFSVVETNA